MSLQLVGPPWHPAGVVFLSVAFGYYLAIVTRRGGNTLKRIRLVLTISVVMGAMLIATAHPTAAQGFGPSVACNADTLNNCTDSASVGSSKESFICEGKRRDTISCTNRRTSETAPY